MRENSKLMLLVLSIAGGMGIATSVPANETIAHTYNALGRLVEVQSSGAVNNNQGHSVCYDKAGNRVTYASSSAGTPAACVTQG